MFGVINLINFYMKTPKEILLILVFFSLHTLDLQAQSEKLIFFKGGIGHQAIRWGNASETGKIYGVGIDFQDTPNRWQLVIEASNFGNRNTIERWGRYRGVAANFQFGKIWTSNLELSKRKLEFGTGVLGMISLDPNPSLVRGIGVYGRMLIPIYEASTKDQLYFYYEPSYFGDGLIRNVFGLAYRLK